MAKKLTGTELAWSKAVLHDIFEAGDLLKRPVRTSGTNYITRFGIADLAKIICDEIKFRSFDFPKVNAAISRISSRVTFSQLHDNNRKRLTELQISNIIAAFCAEHEILWDDVNTHRTTTEMETYRMSSFGRACWDFRCFASQQTEKKATRSAPTRSIDPATGKAVPKSGYKSSGPKSGLIKGLIGEPGEKSVFSGGKLMFVIICNSSKAKKQYVFVDPLAYKADINKVRFGDPSGYSACKLFFDSEAVATGAVTNIMKSGRFKLPADITGLEIAKQKADPNGYFLINTDLGPAYIKASKLNEAIDNDMEESCEKHNSRFPNIDNIDVYSEAMHCYE